MNWRKRYRTPESGNKVRVKFKSGFEYSQDYPYKEGDILTIHNIYSREGDRGNFWSVDGRAYGILDTDFEVIQ